MKLKIDTSKLDKINISLIDKETKIVEQNFEAKYQQAEKLLPSIDKMLKKAKFNLRALQEILVENRGDSFSGLRIGVVTANALGYALGIPVKAVSSSSVEQKTNQFDVVAPIYSKEPNIT